MELLAQLARVTLFGSKGNARNAVSFNINRDIPSMTGKVVLVTGGAGGMGREIVMELARHGRPARIYIADLPLPDEDSEQTLIKGIVDEAYGSSDNDSAKTEIRFLELDLGSKESTRQCAANFLAEEDRLDVLILNAGVLKARPATTKEGFELHFGINYVGHARFSKLLIPIMQRTAERWRKEGGEGNGRTRMVIVSSEGYAMAPKGGIVFDKLRTNCEEMSYFARYGQSKLALIHLTRRYAELYPDIEVVTVHPGRVTTGMGLSLQKESFLIKLTAPLAPFLTVTANVGARNAIWAATSSGVVSGKYYEPVGVPDMETSCKNAMDKDLCQRLWEWTQEELKDWKV